MRKPWNTYSIIYFFSLCPTFCDHYSFTEKYRQNKQLSKRWAWLKWLLSINGNNHTFFLQEKDVFISCHGHNLFHIDQNFLPSFFSNHGNLTKKRTYSNSGKFQTSKCGILLPLVYYWNLFPVFFLFPNKEQSTANECEIKCLINPDQDVICNICFCNELNLIRCL